MDKKRAAGEHSAGLVEAGMIVGLGTGSTVYWAIRRLGERLAAGLRIRGAVPTSLRTAELAAAMGIPLYGLSKAALPDLTIDGADEVDDGLNLIKGGGGALLREKLVAAASASLVIVVDESKLVRTLGAFPLPVEIVPFGRDTTEARIGAAGFSPTLRLSKDGKPFVTDNGNYIADCAAGAITDPAEAHRKLKIIAGVVETGLFTGMANQVIVGGDAGVTVLERR